MASIYPLSGARAAGGPAALRAEGGAAEQVGRRSRQVGLPPATHATHCRLVRVRVRVRVKVWVGVRVKGWG